MDLVEGRSKNRLGGKSAVLAGTGYAHVQCVACS